MAAGERKRKKNAGKQPPGTPCLPKISSSWLRNGDIEGRTNTVSDCGPGQALIVPSAIIRDLACP